MLHEWWSREIHRELWWVDLKEGDCVKDLQIGYYLNEFQRDRLGELGLDSFDSG
jgi:hypothetical protein